MRNHYSGPVQFVVDVVGYFSAGAADTQGAYVAVRPERVLDTRRNDGGATPGPHGVLALPVEGVHGLPSTHVLAVLVNVTVTAPSAAGYVSAYTPRPGYPRPPTSSLDFARGQTVSNLIAVQPAADGTIDLYNGALGSTPMIADVIGYYYSADAAVPDARLSGRVTAAANGAGLPGIRVEVDYVLPKDGDTFYATTTTRADGTWSMPVESDEYDYTVLFGTDPSSEPGLTRPSSGARSGPPTRSGIVQAVAGTTTTGVDAVLGRAASRR